MADGDFATLVSATRDANTVSNQMFVQITDGTEGANVDANNNLNVILAANDGVDIGDVDVTSVVPGTGATNLGKAEDAAHTSGDVGVAMLVLRQDTQSNLVADGDYTLPTVNASGELRVTGGGSNASVVVDDTGFTAATDSITLIGAANTADSVDSGDRGALRMLTNRALVTTIEDPGGDAIAIDASNNLQVILAANDGVDIGDVDVTSVIPGTGATNLGKAVDSAGGATDTGVAALFLRDDALTTLTPADGDYVRGRTTSTGALWTNDVTLDANAETSPLFVQVVNTAVSGSEIHDYNTAASVAGDGTSNHDYTVANTTFLLKSIIWASSGGSKAELQTGPVASLETDAVGFIEKAGGVEQLFFDPPIEVPVTSTGTVRIIRTNRQGQPQDLYSTIIGNDVT